MKVPAGKNKAIAFFDSLRKGDKIPTIRNFSYMFADWSKTALNVRAYTDEQEGAGFYSCSNLTKTIIQTNNVTLSAEWGKNDDGCYLSQVTLTTKFPSGDSLSQTFDILNPEFKKNK